jgi:hypothetical protein
MGSGAQLDLFLDSRAVVLANEVAERLLAHDARAAESALFALEREGPGHPGLPALRVLVQFARDWQPPPRRLADIGRLAARLEQQIAPAVAAALDSRGLSLIESYYRELAAAADGLPYDPEHARAHAAALWLRCGEFAASEQAIQSIPGWRDTPETLRWCSLGRYALYGLAGARPALFALAWRAPQQVDRLVRELRDDALQRDWSAFESCDWPTTASAALPAWFPAWYVLEHPAAAADIALAGEHDSPAAGATQLAVRILDLERAGSSAQLLRLRDQLRTLNPDLFSHYMARRSVFHR